jgi:DNA adenine methylase
MKNLGNTYFDCKDYRELNPEGYIIYCDPPYEGTTQYSKKLVGDFDTNEFWSIMRKWSNNNKVFISEYNAPR